MATKYRITVRREGERVTISKTPGGESIQWTHPDVDIRGRIGFIFARGRGGILRHVDGVPFMRDLGGVIDPEPTTDWAAAPDYTVEYAKLQNDVGNPDAGSIVQTADYAELRGGAITAGDWNPHSVMIWSQRTIGGNFRWRARIRKADTLTIAGTGAGELFGLVYLCARGDGTTNRPADMSSWPASSDASSQNMRDHISAIRLGLYYMNPTQDTETQTLNVHILRADGSVTQIAPNTAAPMPQLANVDYLLTAEISGNTLTLTREGGGTQVRTYTSPLIGQFATQGNVGYAVSAGRRLRVSEVSVQEVIDPGDPGEPAEGFPGAVWHKVPPTVSERPNQVTVTSAGDLQAAINAATPGRTIVVAGDFGMGNIQVSCQGTATAPIIICSDRDGDDETAFRRLTGPGRWQIGTNRPCMHTIIRGFQMDNIRVSPIQTDTVQFECNRITGIVNTNSTSAYSQEWLKFDNAVPTGPRRFLLGYLHYEGNRASFFDGDSVARPTDLLTTHCHIDRLTGTAKVYQQGRNSGNGTHDMRHVFQYSLVSGLNITEKSEHKTNGTTLRHCTLEAVGGQSRWQVRHGRCTPPDTPPLVGRGNYYIGNLFLGVSPLMDLRGHSHRAINNWCVTGLGASEQPTLQSPLGNGRIGCASGNISGQTFPQPGEDPVRRPSVFRAVCAGNRGFRVDWYSEEQVIVRPRECIIPAAGPGRNTAYNPNNFEATISNMTVPGANIDQPPRRLFPANVGPRAWRTTFLV